MVPVGRPKDERVETGGAASLAAFSEEFKRDALRLVVEGGYTFKAASAAVGVSDQTLRAWHAKLVSPPEPCGENATLQELHAENQRLRRGLRRAELSARSYKKSHGVFRAGVAVKYVWIGEHRESFPIAVMCDALGVSTSGYYASIVRPLSPRAQRHERIKAAVAQVHADSHGIYGSLKITQVLGQQNELERAHRNTVATAMRELGLPSRVRKAFAPTTTQVDPMKSPAPNTLQRNFTAPAPNRKWVTDITYPATAEGWVYLAVVLDLFSRKVVG